MKCLFKLEAIGLGNEQEINFYQSLTTEVLGKEISCAAFGKRRASYYVAEICGFHNIYKYERKFLKGKRDYTLSNSKGTRGIYVYYVLDSNIIYEVRYKTSWKSQQQYFIKTDNIGNYEKIDEQGVISWIKEKSE